jgi:protein-tyrosine-phosphatase
MSSTVLFICEHGSAKSVVAAAHFNRLAAQRGLDLHAVSRGTDPDEQIHAGALTGLEREGLHPASEPRRLTQADIQHAVAVVAFGELPAPYSPPAAMQVWAVPPISEDYEASRDAILQRIETLLAELAIQS